MADVITFGVAPSILAYHLGVPDAAAGTWTGSAAELMQWGVFVCFLFLICGACRLARFNIRPDPLPRNPGRPGRKYFVGMPIPAAAGVLAAVVHFFNGTPCQLVVALAWMVVVLLGRFLMVSTWRFWKRQGNHSLVTPSVSRAL